MSVQNNIIDESFESKEDEIVVIASGEHLVDFFSKVTTIPGQI